MPAYFAGAKAFIFPALDDFGITPVEALAAGTPVVAYKAGGALDYIRQGKTGLFFEEQTAESLGKSLEICNNTVLNHADIRRFAQQFSPLAFSRQMNDLIEKIV